MSHHKYEPGIHYWESCLDQCKIRENGQVLCIKQCKTLAQSMDTHRYNCFYINLNQVKKFKRTKPCPPSVSHQTALFWQLHRNPVALHSHSPLTPLPVSPWQQLHVSILPGDGTHCKFHPLTSAHPLVLLFLHFIISQACSHQFPQSRSPCSAVLAVLSSNTNLSHRYSHLST